MGSGPSTQEYATASSLAYNLSTGTFTPPDGWTVVATSKPVTVGDGFEAVVLKDPSGNIIIANEGTLFTASNLSYGSGVVSADLSIENGQTPPALNDASDFAIQVQEENPSSPIYVTGHSLGGTEAEAEAQALGAKLSGGMTFGATGLPGNTESGPSTLVNVVDEGDPVGNDASDGLLSSIAPPNMLHYGSVDTVSEQPWRRHSARGRCDRRIERRAGPDNWGIWHDVKWRGFVGRGRNPSWELAVSQAGQLRK